MKGILNNVSPENQIKIKAAVKEAGDFLDGKLPPKQGLMKRNSYAHLWERIKAYFGVSYKNVPDDQVDEMLYLIQTLRNDT